MIIYPAIDLISGRAVRLERGDYNKKTEYSNDPISVAKQFEVDGAKYIHIVDLDGAKAKKPMNIAVIEQISKAVGIPIQVGGGIRSVKYGAQLLEYAERVIIGTLAITEPSILEEMIANFGAAKVVVSVDYKDGLPVINGWLEKSKLTTDTLKARLTGFGITTVIVTDTSKDGLLGGPNVELMKQWKDFGFEIICAGGITTVEDIAELKKANIDGAIIGKALYEGKINLKEAFEC